MSFSIFFYTDAFSFWNCTYFGLLFPISFVSMTQNYIALYRISLSLQFCVGSRFFVYNALLNKGIPAHWHIFLDQSVKQFRESSQCLKIAQKVAFNMASVASYVYIFSGQKFIKNIKNSSFWRFFKNFQSNSVTR